MKRGRRGRPLKYGRPARVVTVTLPGDTIEELRAIHSDLGHAIVTLANAFLHSNGNGARPVVDYERMGRRRSLIVVDREAVAGIPGCELIPIGDDRALLSVENGRRLQDLELAIIDRLADGSMSARRREALEELRHALKETRQASDLEVEPRSIFVVEKSPRPR